MTQKRFRKLLMSCGFPHHAVRGLVEYMKDIRSDIETGGNMILLADAKTMEFRVAKIHSYAETYRRIIEGLDPIG